MVKYVTTKQNGRKAEGQLIVDEDGYPINATNRFPVEAEITVEDIEIGAVELKNSTTDDRATVIKPGTEGALIIEKIHFAERVDDYTTANVTYVGKAATGSLTSAAVWQIRKIDVTTGMSLTWADGDALFNNIWDNRATTVVYS
jgi:hypothetical protein